MYSDLTYNHPEMQKEARESLDRFVDAAGQDSPYPIFGSSLERLKAEWLEAHNRHIETYGYTPSIEEQRKMGVSPDTQSEPVRTEPEENVIVVPENKQPEKQCEPGWSWMDLKKSIEEHAENKQLEKQTESDPAEREELIELIKLRKIAPENKQLEKQPELDWPESEENINEVPENKQPQKTNTFGRKTYRALKDYAQRIKTYGHASPIEEQIITGSSPDTQPEPAPAEPEKSKKAVPKNKQPQKTNTFGRKTYRALKDYARRIKTYGHAPYHAVIDYALSPHTADPLYSPFFGQKFGQTNLPPPVYTVPIAVGYGAMIAASMLFGPVAAIPYVAVACAATGFVVGSRRGTSLGGAVMGAIAGGGVGSIVGVIMGNFTVIGLNLPQNLAASAFSKVPVLGQLVAPPPVRPLCNPYTIGHSPIVHRC